MGKYQFYSDMKDSGVEWLDHIPTNWSSMPIAALLEERNEKNTGEKTDTVLSVMRDIGVILYDDKGDVGNKKSEDIERYKIVRPGDLVVNSMNVIIGSVGVSKYYGALSPVYYVLKPRKIAAIQKDFVGYVFRIKTFQRWLKRLGYGILDHRMRIPMDNLKREYLPVPPYEVQEKITQFLDHETAKIDHLIANQQRLIDLLKEKRQAVISHVITKGLNPNAPMKDSGVEWLGDVPAHWKVGKVKHVFSNLDHRRIPVSSEERGKRIGEYPYYGASGIIDTIDDYLFDEDLVLVGEDGANLVLRSTPLAFVARGKYWVNNHAHIIKPIDGLVEYWAKVVDLVDVTPLVVGAAQPKLTASALANLKIVYSPDYDERKTIQEYIFEKENEFGHLMNKAVHAIELLKEHRTALISAAVTGKIDVRDWKKPEQQQLQKAAETATG